MTNTATVLTITTIHALRTLITGEGIDIDVFQRNHSGTAYAVRYADNRTYRNAGSLLVESTPEEAWAAALRRAETLIARPRLRADRPRCACGCA